MGGCANSKYVVDEDKNEKKPLSKNESLKKDKKSKKDKKGELITDSKNQVAGVPDSKTNEPLNNEAEKSAPKVEKEEIDFIDKEDAAKQQASLDTKKKPLDSLNNDTKTSEAKLKIDDEKDEEKKEVTTYQTTVVKHSQKEGEELLNHLKDEAFITLQNLLKSKENANKDPNSPTIISKTTTKTFSVDSSKDKTSQPVNESESAESLVSQIKAQVNDSLGKTKEQTINAIIDQAVGLIKEDKVKSMNDLQTELENLFDTEKELVKKVINASTGYLTAKGTEAGAILSNILANVNNGIQGIMNETERTTVKVTRTVTENVMSDGQFKEITKVVTSYDGNQMNENLKSSNIETVLKNFAKSSQEGVSRVSGTSTVNESSHSTEVKEQTEVEPDSDDTITKKKAKQVVNSVVNAAVEKIIDESAHQKNQSSFSDITEENIKIEEENTVKCTTTKIILNKDEQENTNITLNKNELEQVQTEFFKNGKSVAEELIKTIVNTGENASN